MNLIRIILITAAISFIFQSCRQADNTEEVNAAAAYSDSIIHQQENIIQYLMVLNKDIAMLDSVEIIHSYDELRTQTGESLQQVEDMEPFKGDNSLRSAALDLFQFYHDIFNNEYEEIIGILLKGQDSITEADLAVIDSVSTTIEVREKQFDEKFKQVHEDFAKKHNLILKKREREEGDLLENNTGEVEP